MFFRFGRTPDEIKADMIKSHEAEETRLETKINKISAEKPSWNPLTNKNKKEEIKELKRMLVFIKGTLRSINPTAAQKISDTAEITARNAKWDKEQGPYRYGRKRRSRRKSRKSRKSRKRKSRRKSRKRKSRRKSRKSK